MLEELKNAYKLVQYGLSLKKQMAFAVGFAVIGIVLDVVTRGRQATGSFYIVLSGLFIYQLIISSDVSTLVQSSPYKKKIQITYPLLAVIPWNYITFTIVVIMHGLFIKADGAEYATTHSSNVFLIGLLLMITMAYFGVCYKFFISSIVIMMLLVFSAMIPVNILLRKGCSLFDSYGLCVGLAYVLLTLGTVISFLLSKLVYKFELSKLAFKMMLKS